MTAERPKEHKAESTLDSRVGELTEWPVNGGLTRDEKLLQQAQKMEALGTLVSGVAHEINNPVNLIIYSIPILRRVWRDVLPVMKQLALENPSRTYGGLPAAYLDDNLGQILSDVELAADRVTKIVSDLKNFARQTDVADTSPVQINEAVNNALRLSGTTIKKSRSRLELQLGDDVPVVEGNLQNMEQIVLNLVINAIQAIDGDGGRIVIETGYRPATGRVYLSVSDNGRGVNPGIAHRLFDPFVTDKQDKGGTGLGLSVTYSLVKAHKGDLTFRAREHGGTVFTVQFPTGATRRQSKVLVADDDDAVRNVVVQALVRDGAHIIREARDGVSACIKLGSFHPDLLILDIFMPEMNGLEVCRVIRSDPALSDLKVIITTGYPEHQILQEVSALGFRNVFFKPFKIGDLLATVTELMDEEASYEIHTRKKLTDPGGG